MKGVILAGGENTRLRPTTKVVSKNLLLAYNKPVIYYPILALKGIGIKEVLIISSPQHLGQIINVVGSGRDFDLKFTYEIQEEPKGLSHGLLIAEDFADNDKIVYILGDNIFDNIKFLKKAKDDFEKQERGAKIALAEVPNPERFGVPKFNKKGDKIIEIVEKPKKSWTNWIIPGFYLLDNRAFEFAKKVKPSARGEYEITDLLDFYAKEGSLTFQRVKGFWRDVGTFDTLLEASVFMAKKARKQQKLQKSK